MANSQVAWGIDIGATALKAIKVRRDGDKVAVEAFDVIEHDKFLSEPDVDRDAIIRTSLQKFIDRNNPRRDTMLISVAGSKTFARFVKLPPVEPKRIPEIVKFEAIQQIPFPLEQVNWDYQTFSNADSPEVEVGIFAMKKDLVAAELSNFTAQKMTIHGVQLSPLALYNAAAYDEWTDGKGTLLIDIGAEHTDLVIVDAGRIWLRTINLGGNHFTEALAKAFKQPFSRAESLKKGAATSKYQKQIFQAMRPVFADLVAEVSRSLGHYQTSHRDSHLERVVAMGNPFKLPNLQKYIQQELKMDVIRLENFKKAGVDTKLAAGLQENILSLGVAYGLALQGLDRAAIDTNLLPVDIAREMIWRNKRPWFAGAAAAVVLACGYWGYTTYAEAAEFDATQQSPLHNANETERARFNKEKGEFDKVSVTYEKSAADVQNLVKLAEYRSLVSQLFDDIYQSVPQKGSATPPGTYPPRDVFIAIKALRPTYRTGLGTAVPNLPDDTVEQKGAATAPATPAAAAGPPGRGGAQAGAGAAGVTGSGDVNDRGFLIEVEGYTPAGASPASASADDVITAFKRNIRDKAIPGSTAAAAKGYSLMTTWYTRDRVPPTAAFGSLAWGWGAGAGAGGNGSYWTYFVPEKMGLEPKRKTAAGFGTPGDAVEFDMPQAPLFPIDAIIARPGKNPATASMVGYTHFIFYVKAKLPPLK